MSYPVYKLLRAVNRQYPNNGFINYVDVREDMYGEDANQYENPIDEDLRDLINETIQEVYKDVALDEVYTFRTVPGQNEYALPEDCDLRDIQEVTRTFVGCKAPLRPPFGPMPPVETFTVTFMVNPLEGNMNGASEKFFAVESGGTLVELPYVTASEGLEFVGWSYEGAIIPNETILSTPVTQDITYMAVLEEDDEMKAILTAGISENVTTAGASIALDLVTKNTGGKTPSLLTIEDGKIVIGDSVSKVKVSGTFSIKDGANTSDVRSFVIQHYSGDTFVEQIPANIYVVSEESAVSCSVSPKLLDVLPGDTLRLRCLTNQSGDEISYGGLYVTVEVVETTGQNPIEDNNDGGYGESPLG